MDEVVKSVFTAPIATLFIVAGIVFLFIAVVGNISGKIEPGEKARVVSGVVGVAFIALGLAMHLLQKTPGVLESSSISSQSKPASLESPPKKPMPDMQLPKQAPMLEAPPSQKQEILSFPLQTNLDGIDVRIVRFEKREKFVLLQLMARNTSDQLRRVCFHPGHTTLIHEPSGESWRPREYVGENCPDIDANNLSRIWMKFDISDPEKKVFSLSSPLLNGILDNLVLTESS